MKRKLQFSQIVTMMMVGLFGLITSAFAMRVERQLADDVTSEVNVWKTVAFDDGVQTGEFTLEFDMVAEKNNIDAVTGLTNLEAAGYSDLSAIVRFNSSGKIDAYDNSGYAAENDLDYSAGTTYHVRMEVNTSQMLYDVYVKVGEGDETTIAKDYTFRRKVINLNAMAVVAGNFNVADPGTHTVSNITMNVISTNDLPVFAAVPDQVINGGAIVELAISAIDPMDAALTLEGTTLPDFATFTDNTDGTGLLTLSPAEDDSDLGDYEIVLTASNGEKSNTTTIFVKVNPYVPIFEVLVDEADVDVFYGTYANDPAKPFVWTGSSELLVGGGVNYQDAQDEYDMAAVMPFKLPAIPDGQEITSASLTASLNNVVTWAWQDYDLYGLPFRSEALVLGTDYYQGAYGEDESATAIQQQWAVKETPVGIVNTSDEGGKALLAYIKEQYANGAVAGDFVFLRVSVSVPDAPTYGRIDIDSNESGNGAVLKVTFGEPNVAPVLEPIEDQVLYEESSLTLSLSATDANSVDLLKFTLEDGAPGFLTLTDNRDGTASLEINPLNADIGVYDEVVVSVSDGTETVSDTFSITVDKILSVDRQLEIETLVYPNPTNLGYVNVQLPTDFQSSHVEIGVYSITGQKMSQQRFNLDPNNEPLKVNVDNSWMSGRYFLQITDGQKSIIKSLYVR
ncbi:MAG: T9SS type A sorting domain-containing protein [Cyclobacteriaceae bacterium]